MNKLVLASTVYRLMDALLDYADTMDANLVGSLADDYRSAAQRIEDAPRQGVLVEVNSFDLDMAHSATIGLMVARREKAQELREAADECDREAKRWEDVLGLLTV